MLSRASASLLFISLQRAAGGPHHDFFYGGVFWHAESVDNDAGNGFGGHHFALWRLRPQCVPDRGIGCSRQEGNYANAFGPQLFTECVSETEGSMLGRVVGG